MRIIENALHPDRKRQENWRQFCGDVDGTFISEGASGGDEIHIPFMEHWIRVSNSNEGGMNRTTLTANYSSGDLQFKIFGWGGRKVPDVDRDPYLNSEFPDLAPRAKVEFNDAKRLTSLLESLDLRRAILEAPASFTMEADLESVRVDNRAHGSINQGVITDVDQLHAALHLMRCALLGMEAMGAASASRVLVAA